MPITCVQGVCDTYDKLYGLKSGTSKARFNLTGNAWELGRNSQGVTRDFDNDVEVGDMITFTRPVLSSDSKKGIPEKNQHVGVVVKIENGIPIIKHYANGWKEEPINKVSLNSKTIYQPSQITHFNVPDKIASRVNIPIIDGMTRAEKQAIATLNKTDFKPLMLNQEQLNDLAYSALSIIGTETKYGNSERALVRAIAPNISNKAQQIRRYLKSDDPNKTFTDFNVEPSAGFGSIKHGETYRTVWYDDLESLPAPDRSKITRDRLKQNQVENLRSTRSKTAKLLGILGFDEKNYENVDVAAITAMAKLAPLYSNSGIPTTNDILKAYKGNSKASNEFDVYKQNYISGKPNDFNGWKQLAYQYIQDKKDLTQAQRRRLIYRLEKETDIPLQFKAFLSDQMGIKTPMTTESLSKAEQDALREVALRAIENTNGIIGYNGDDVTPWISEESERLGSVGGGRVNKKRLKAAFNDPYTALQQTFGQARAYTDGNDIVLVDDYDFNNQGSIYNIKDLLRKTGGDPYGIVRALGSMRGSSPENPRPVMIRIPINGSPKPIVDVGIPKPEEIWIGNKHYGIKNNGDYYPSGDTDSYKYGGLTNMKNNRKKFRKVLPYAISTYITNTMSVKNNAGGEYIPFKNILNSYMTDGADLNLNRYSDYALHYLMSKTEQNAHLLPKPWQERYYKERGYDKNNSSKIKDLFKTQIDGRRVNTYRLNKDVINRNKLKHVGNIHGLNDKEFADPGYTYLSDPLSHSAAIYVDKKGNYYFNAADFNDYGDNNMKAAIRELFRSNTYGLGYTQGASKYGKAQILAELADMVGNPAVIETGILPLSKSQAEFIREYYKDDENIVKHMNAYIGDQPDELTYNGGQIEPVSITASSKKKFGGKLRYGWGGFLTQSDFIDDAMTYRRNFDYIGSYGAYTTNGKDLDKYWWYSSKAPDKEALKNSYYVRYNDDAYEQSGGDLDKYRELLYSVEDGLSNVKHTNPYKEDFETTTLHFVNAYGRDLIDKTNQEGKSIFINMQNKIAKDVARYRPSNDATNAKYGGLVNYRKKYDLGGYSNPYTEKYHSDIPAYSGNLNWGTKVKESDIPYSEYEAKGEGIVGSEMANYATTIGSAGAAIGTTAGLAAGTALGAWGGPIGMGVGALLGLLFGGIFGNRKRKEEEARRRKLLAEQKELNRQNTIGNMQDRHENDVAKIRTFNNNMSFNNNSFYGKFGGMLTRRKLEYGGHIIPNSADTSVAYGRTHEQINPQTGMTGVTYGDAEVEGGGFVNGQEYAGEVIRNTPMGDQIFSNSLPMPGVRATYAQVAKALTDKKGKLEKEIEAQKEAITASQEIFNKAKLGKAKAGTSARNIEKQATLLNRKVGELAEIESQLDQTFASQEELATGLGLRQQNGAYAKYGGYRPKYAFGFNEASLVGNIGIAGLNILANELTGRSNLKQLEFMRNLQTPKQAHVEAEYYNTDYDISNEIAMAAAQYNRNRRFITDNASNAQVLRNAIRKSDIDFLSGYNELRSAQKKYQTERFDLNRNARVQANNTNRQIDYANLVADYNKNMDYYQAVIGVKNQLQQNRMAALNQLGDAFSSYASTKIQEGMWAEGVRDDMYGITTLSEKDVAKDGDTVLGVPMYNRKGKHITTSKGKKVYLPAGTKVQGLMYYDTKTRSWKPIRRYGV